MIKVAQVLLTLAALGLVAAAQQPTGTSTTVDQQQVLDYLNQTVNWYGHLAVEAQVVTDPADLPFMNDNKQLALQIVRLAFDFARAQAAILTQTTPAGDHDHSHDVPAYQALSRAASDADASISRTQAEIDLLKKKLQGTDGRGRRDLQARLDETQSELALAETRSQTLHEVLQFVSQTDTAKAPGVWRRRSTRCSARSLKLTRMQRKRPAEQRMLAAVERVYAGYREKIEQQHRQIERTFSFAIDTPQPQSRLRLTQAGLEVVIRYPIDLENSAEVDDQITRALLDALEQLPKLRLVGSGVPNIQPVTEESTTA